MMNDDGYVVIFVSSRTGEDESGYDRMADRMAQLAAAEPGFVAMHSARNLDGSGITVCFWRSEAAIAAWKRNVDHQAARELGRTRWYTDYDVTVARVEQRYSSNRP